MKDLPGSSCGAAPLPPEMDAAFRNVSLRRVRCLRHALEHAEATGWRDAALLVFGEIRREAERLDYALIADLSGVGLLAARASNAPPQGERMLCSQIAQALSTALEHGATGFGGASARLLRDRLRGMAPVECARCAAAF